jgi:hypothetical protein
VPVDRHRARGLNRWFQPRDLFCLRTPAHRRPWPAAAIRSAETKVVRWGMRSNLGPNLTLPVDLPVCADPISIAKAVQEVVALVLHLHQVGQETFTHAGHTTKPLTR